MEKGKERRKEERKQLKLPVWFCWGDELREDELHEGTLLDISSSGAAFSRQADESCPHVGQQISLRVNIPKYGQQGANDTMELKRFGKVHRVDILEDNFRRIAVLFDVAPPFWNERPGEGC